VRAEFNMSDFDIQIWFLPIEEGREPAIEQHASLLDTAEHEKAGRFAFERDRRHYIAAHALLRVMLSSFVPIPPRRWRFKTGPFGRPEIEPTFTTVPLRFNLSHTRGLVACCVTLRRDVGLDVEAVDRPVPDINEIAMYFTQMEQVLLRSSVPARRHQLFFELWTLKEAYVKAIGKGLTLPLDSFGFELDPLGIDFPDRHDDGRRWFFHLARPTEQHQLALAARNNLATTPHVSCSRVSLPSLLPIPDQDGATTQ